MHRSFRLLLVWWSCVDRLQRKKATAEKNGLRRSPPVKSAQTRLSSLQFKTPPAAAFAAAAAAAASRRSCLNSLPPQPPPAAAACYCRLHLLCHGDAVGAG